MSDESISVAILLSSENIPKEIFLNSVDEYFGPQIEDFKNSSLSICILSDKTGLLPSKNNSAMFIKSQWMFQTTLTSCEIFEFKLAICDNKLWSIILSEDLNENRLIETFKVPSDKIIVVHLEWNKPHTVTVESLVDLYSMDESLIKSHYENQEISESFKNLETITEDNCDDESLIDSLREESKKSNEDSKTENHDTDDSLEKIDVTYIKELETKNSDSENNIGVSENLNLNKIEENIKPLENNDIYMQTLVDSNISNKESQRKTVLLKNIQSILGVKSELNQIKSSGLIKEQNSTRTTNLEKKKNSLIKKNMKDLNLIHFVKEPETGNFFYTMDIGFDESVILPYIQEVKELQVTVAIESSLLLNIKECTLSCPSIHVNEVVQATKNNLICFNNDSDNFNSNISIADNTVNNLKLQKSQNFEVNDEQSLPNLFNNSSNQVTDNFFTKCAVSTEEEALLNSDVIANIITQPYSCMLVVPSEEIQNIDFCDASEAVETFENIFAEFYHENVFQPKINQADSLQNELNYIPNNIEIIHGEKNELVNFENSRDPSPQSICKNDIIIPVNKNLHIEHDLNDVKNKLKSECIINQSDIKNENNLIDFESSTELIEKLGNNKISPINKFEDQRYVNEIQSIPDEIATSVGDMIVKFETLKETEKNNPKIRLDKEKDQNRISGIVKQFEEFNLKKEYKDSSSEIEDKDIEKTLDKKSKPFKYLNEDNFCKEKNLISKEIHDETMIIVEDENKKNINNKQENQHELRINDDYKYPDSVTPTKVEHTLSQLKVYDVPFIDDDVFIKESSFKDDNEKLSIMDHNHSSNSVNNIMKITPKASIETLTEIEIEKIKLSIETEVPVKKRKGLLNLCGCVGGRKRS